MSTVLITVQIPFYHFCTVCCTGDLVLLLDDRKAAYCSLLAGRFTAPGFLGIRQGRWVAVVDPPVAALPPPHDHSQTGWSRGGPPRPCSTPWILRAPASCPGVTSLFVSGAQWGRAPDPSPPSVRGSFFFPAFLLLLLFLDQNRAYSQSVPLPQVPNASHCTELSSSWTPGPEPWSQRLLFPVVLSHLPGPTLHSPRLSSSSC